MAAHHSHHHSDEGVTQYPSEIRRDPGVFRDGGEAGREDYSHLNPPARYHDYLAAHQRVANWVEQARNYQASDSMTASSRNSGIEKPSRRSRSRTDRRPTSANPNTGTGTESADAPVAAPAPTQDPLAASYPSPPASHHPLTKSSDARSHSRSHRARARASSSGTERRRRRTKEDLEQVPPVPPLPTIGHHRDMGALVARSRSSLKSPLAVSFPDPTSALALISSSLVVCAFLPSILTVSAFVVFLTLASVGGQEKQASEDVEEAHR